MLKAVITVVGLLAAAATAEKYHSSPVKTFGDVCSSNSDCLGTNQFCKIQSRLDPPCRAGYCACLEEYVYAAGFCVEEIPIRNLGEDCGLKIGEVIKVKNAGCFFNSTLEREIVSCRKGYVESRGRCLARNTCPRGDVDCPSGMHCSNETWPHRCICKHEFMMFNDNAQKCLPREFGAPCTNDRQCQVEGVLESGYTWSTGRCLNGTCQCLEQETIVAYLEDEMDNVAKRKPICVRNQAPVNVSQGESCRVDPVFFSDETSTKVCNHDLVCVQCPEEFTDGFFSSRDGLCRSIKVISDPLSVLPPLSINSEISRNLQSRDPSYQPPVEFVRPDQGSGFFPCVVPKVAHGKVTTMLGERLAGLVFPGVEVALLCSHGYRVAYGVQISTCMLNGRFSNPIGICISMLEDHNLCDLPTPLNGVSFEVDDTDLVNENQIRPGGTIVLICPRGYSYSDGVGFSRCGMDGNWSAGLGKCVDIDRNADN